MNTPRPANPFNLVLCTVVLLACLSLANGQLAGLAIEVRPVNLLADILRTPKLLRHPPVMRKSAPVATADEGLASFLQALHQTRQYGTKTRIAYFGDSMIEGDLVTGELRQLLQQTFGGQGVGYVPIAAVAADFRQTIHETASENWTEFNLVSHQVSAQYPLGLSGHVFIPKPAGSSWVHYRANLHDQAPRRFAQIRLFYGPGDTQDHLVMQTGTQQLTQSLTGTEPLNQLVLQADSGVSEVKATFKCRSPRSVYGFSFETKAGITLDNFSFRGNSGLWLRRIAPVMLTAFAQHQDYQLIILHYGANVADRRVTSYRQYERAMVRVVNQFRRAFPRASVLVIGMSDKSTRAAGSYVTDPSVPRLLLAQQQLARNCHAAFWNLYEAMGGENTMVDWVAARPPLANRDYTHVTLLGGRKIAGLLYSYLMQQYTASGPPLLIPKKAPS